MRQRILIIDDDCRHRNLLASYFESQGFDTLLAADAIEMKKQRERYHCDLLVLDVNMPGEDGISICKRLRASGDKIPIVIVTARNEVVDKILGLEYGSDDYLAKPFDPRELVARIRAVLRRIPDNYLNAYQATPETFQFGAFVLDVSSRSLFCNEQLVALSFDEFELLKILVSTPGQPLSRHQIANQIRSGGQQLDQRNIDMLVSRLRKRLMDGSSQCQYIQSVRGVGYVFMNPALDQAWS
ncbi:MAG: DNA-binding response regulator [Pseudomonadota bacterium]|jgi:two-component system phosphate regulon response regulator OmpR